MSNPLLLFHNQGKGRPIDTADVIKYILWATFDAVNQGYADGQLLDTPAEGMRAGHLTVVEVDGTLAIVNGKCAFTAQGTPNWGDQGFYSQAITRALGLGLLGTYNKNTANTYTTHRWQNAGNIGEGARIYTLYLRFSSQIGVGIEANPVIVVGSYSGTTDYEIAIILGGYDSNGLPWYQGQAKSNYKYGAWFLIKGGAFTNWTLLWTTALNNTATLYAALSNYDAVGTIDNFRVPDVDLSAVQGAITNLSTFTAANGTSLDAITPEVGGGWTEQVGDWDIQSNRAQGDSLPNIATVSTSMADFIGDTVVRMTATGNVQGGITIRLTDMANYWRVTIKENDQELQIIERNGGVSTTRASAAITLAQNTNYDVRAIAVGQNIDGFFDGGSKISYATAALNENETTHGIITVSANVTVDTFAIYPRTSGIYDSVLGGV